MVNWVNPLPNDKILEKSILKAFADDKTNVTEKLKLVLGSIENIVGKGENAGSQLFFFSPQCFLKNMPPRVVKGQDCVVQG